MQHSLQSPQRGNPAILHNIFTSPISTYKATITKHHNTYMTYRTNATQYLKELQEAHENNDLEMYYKYRTRTMLAVRDMETRALCILDSHDTLVRAINNLTDRVQMDNQRYHYIHTICQDTVEIPRSITAIQQDVDNYKMRLETILSNHEAIHSSAPLSPASTQYPTNTSTPIFTAISQVSLASEQHLQTTHQPAMSHSLEMMMNSPRAHNQANPQNSALTLPQIAMPSSYHPLANATAAFAITQPQVVYAAPQVVQATVNDAGIQPQVTTTSIMPTATTSIHTTPQTTAPHPATMNISYNYRPVKVQLKQFGGDPFEWNEFWSLFEALIHTNSNYSNIEKFKVLTDNLHGEPAEYVSLYAMNPNSYDEAISFLLETYSQRPDMPALLLQKIGSLVSEDNSLQKQLALIIKCKTLLLRTDKKYYEYNPCIQSTIQQKFTRKVCDKVCDELFGKESDTMTVVNTIKSTIEKLINREKYHSTYQQSTQQNSPNKTHVKTFRNSQFSSSQNKGSYQNQNQGSYQNQNRNFQPSQTYQNQGQYQNQNRQQGFRGNNQQQSGFSQQNNTTVMNQATSGQSFQSANPSANLTNFVSPFPPPQQGNTILPPPTSVQQMRPKTFTPSKPNPQNSSITNKSNNPASQNTSAANTNQKGFQSQDPRYSSNNQNSSAFTAVAVPVEEQSDDMEEENFSYHCNGSIDVLPTALVDVINTDTMCHIQTVALLDSGANLNIVSKEICSALNLPITPDETKINGFQSNQGKAIGTASLALRKKDGTLLNLTCYVVDDQDQPFIGKLKTPKMTKKDLEYLEANFIVSAHDYSQQSTVLPKVLVGCTPTLTMIKPPHTTLPSGRPAINTELGTIVLGEASNDEENWAMLSILPRSIEETAEQFFNVQSIANFQEKSEKDQLKADNELVEQHFLSTVQMADDKFVVQYCTKPIIDQLPSNYSIAYKRLVSQYTSLQENRTYLEYYDQIINDQIKAQQVEEVSADEYQNNQRKHYIAHKYVERPDKPTTPLRIVFDASAKYRGAPSLNDCLYPGPNQLQEIPALLTRARSSNSILCADVEKAFLQIHVDDCQKDLLRFLWVKDINKPPSHRNVKILRFRVTPFGVTASPFMLMRCIQYAIEVKLQNPDLTQRERDILTMTKNNCYVDNIVITIPNPGIDDCVFLKTFFQSMNMNLREFTSNDASLIHSLPAQDQGKIGPQKLLGVIWDSTSDTIAQPVIQWQDITTKREAVSAAATNFDPLGLFAPMFLQQKLFCQSLWRLRKSWDEKLTEDLVASWHCLKKNMVGTPINIQRSLDFDSLPVIHFAMFTDASSQATGACCYVYSKDNKPRLVLSRTRICSLNKSPTIPKAELDAANMGVQLMRYIVKAIRLQYSFEQAEIVVHSFCDSTTVLHWIAEENQYKKGPYVSNRLKMMNAAFSEMREKFKVRLLPFRYVPTSQNPADFLTRGLSHQDLTDSNSLWWNGPNWLSNDPDTWNQHTTSGLTEADQPPPDDKVVHLAKLDSSDDVLDNSVFDLQRFSNYTRLLNTAAYVKRAISKFQGKKSPTGPLTIQELRQGFITIIKSLQNTIGSSHPLIQKGSLNQDKDGIWRATEGRIGNTDLPHLAKSPIYLPYKCKRFLQLVTLYVHKHIMHQGVDATLNHIKAKFWVKRSRSIVKSTLQSCVSCQKIHKPVLPYPASPALPGNRVVRSPPFSACGLDYAGPFENSSDDEKRYILVFTCFSTRLIHLETVTNQTASTFLNALRRFCARRGTPSLIRSDKAPTFVMASEFISANHKGYQSPDQHPLINTFLTSNGVQWSFTTAHAPWQGGIYERMIRSIKDSMRKSIGRKKLSLDAFQTFTTEVEAVINARPLTYVPSDDEQDLQLPAIRPADFIIPNMRFGYEFQVTGEDEDDDPTFVPQQNMTHKQFHRSIAKHNKLLDVFWNRWYNEYLIHLRDRRNANPLSGASQLPAKGTVVIIMDENPTAKRSDWQLARVIDTPNERTVLLKSSAGNVIERPPNLLVPLELELF